MTRPILYLIFEATNLSSICKLFNSTQRSLFDILIFFLSKNFKILSNKYLGDQLYSLVLYSNLRYYGDWMPLSELLCHTQVSQIFQLCYASHLSFTIEYEKFSDTQFDNLNLKDSFSNQMNWHLLCSWITVV